MHLWAVRSDAGLTGTDLIIHPECHDMGVVVPGGGSCWIAAGCLLALHCQQQRPDCREQTMFTAQFWKDAAERSVKTFAQAAGALLAGDGVGLMDVSWLQVASIAGMAAVVSLLTSIASAPVGASGTASLIRAKTLVLALCAILSCGATASAQVAKVSWKQCNGVSCTFHEGTCVNIGNRNGRAYFLTAGHVVLGGTSPVVYLRDGGVEARIEAADREPDLGLLSLPMTPSVQDSFPVAEDVTETSLEFVGFTYGRAFTKRQASRARRSNGLLIAVCHVDSGDSGGPFLEKNKVVGILSATDGTSGYASDCITIRRWLMGRVGFVPGSLTSPQPPTPTLPQSQPAVACRCSAEIASLRAEIAALKAQCGQHETPLPPAPPPISPDITKRLDELEVRIAAMAELTTRIRSIEFEIDKVRLAGGKTEQLEKELAALRDKTFEVRSLAPDGKVVSSETKKLGDNIDLRLVPKRQ